MKRYIFSAFIVVASVAVFFLLLTHWGNLGALFSSLIFAGIIENVAERTTKTND